MNCSLDTTLEARTSPVTSAENLSFRDKSAVQKPKPSSEREYYKAFHDLEGSVCDLAQAGAVMETIMNSQLGKTDSKNETVSFEMSRDDWEMVFFVMYQVTNRCRDLRDGYLATCQRIHPVGNA